MSRGDNAFGRWLRDHASQADYSQAEPCCGCRQRFSDGNSGWHPDFYDPKMNGHWHLGAARAFL
jgi:hypothetical protein